MPLDGPQITVLEAGFLTTVQDLGRTTHLDQGFPVGGAMDRRTVTLINSLLGNAADAPVLEFCQLGPTLKFDRDAIVSLGGYDLSPMLDQTSSRPWTQIHVQAGQTLTTGPLNAGTWGYIAIQGGFHLKPQFGSCSTHLHLGIGGHGGRVLAVADTVPYLPPSTTMAAIGLRHRDQLVPTDAPIRCLPGAQWDWYTARTQEQFSRERFQVTPRSNRVGYRLAGPPLSRHPDYKARELTSEGACAGTVQVLPDGQLIVLMADSQTLGGYPKIANVIQADLHRVAQTPFHQELRFELSTSARAIQEIRNLEHLAARIKLSAQLES